MSTVTLGPRYVVDGPVPQAPPYRLLAPGNPSVEIVDSGDPHWQAGVSVWGYPTETPSVWDGCGDHGTDVKALGGDVPLPVFAAYTLYLPITCTSLGVDPRDLDGWNARATAAFLATESHALEAEFAKGDAMPLNPFLGDANVDLLNSGGATDAKTALAYLVDAVGETGRQGLIHATPATIVGFSELDVYRDRDNIFSVDGVPIVRGSGYIGATPSGGSDPGAGEAWAFATGPVKIFRGPIVGIPETPAEALDRENNVFTFMAERSFVVVWDGALQVAILVDWST